MAESPDKKPSARHGRHGQPKPRPAGGAPLSDMLLLVFPRCSVASVLIAYEGFYVLANSLYAFRVASNFRLLDAAHVPTDGSCRCAFFCSCAVGYLVMRQLLCFSHWTDLRAGRHVAWLSPWS
jgi:hypothetical protein